MSEAWRANTEHSDVVLRFDGVSKTYRLRRESLRHRPAEVAAVQDVSLEVRRGETVGLVGESGCGKSTLGRMGLAMLPPDRGRLYVCGEDPSGVHGARRRALRRRVQAVFQDPGAALNPRRTIGQSVAEPLLAGGTRGAAARSEVVRLLELVGIDPARAGHRPSQLSGGQRQRVVIARALATQPDVLIADEPVSALDVSVQAQIVNLLRDVQRERGTASLFISHDLAVVGLMADRVAVMYLGELVETGPAAEVLLHPAHPYTVLLRAASAAVDAHADEITPENAELEQPVTDGCPFAPRCVRRQDRCLVEKPALRQHGAVAVACHFPER